MKVVLPLVAASLLCVSPELADASLVVVPAPGFTISYDGNDGEHFDPNPPPGGAAVPDNLALASNGATAFSSGDLGTTLGLAFHVAANANDGIYGNRNAWIGAGSSPGFIGVDISGGAGTLYDLTSFAFGRDNGNGALDGSDPGTDTCGGQCSDRWLGVYDMQITTAPVVGAGSVWTSIGSLDYQSSDDAVLGGLFTPYFRHQFEVTTAGGSPVQATGFRIVVPVGIAIDEIELFGAMAASAVPEPFALSLIGAGVVLLMGFASVRRHPRGTERDSES